MTNAEREAIIEGFEHAYTELRDLVFGINRDQLTYVPPEVPDAWSIDAHLVHLLDADCNLVFRVRGGIAEPGIAAPVWNQEAWQKANVYAKSDGKAALAIAISLRAFIAASLREISPAAWDAAGITHPERGPLSLVQLLEMYTGHAATHLKYARRNLESFAKRTV